MKGKTKCKSPLPYRNANRINMVFLSYTKSSFRLVLGFKTYFFNSMAVEKAGFQLEKIFYGLLYVAQDLKNAEI